MIWLNSLLTRLTQSHRCSLHLTCLAKLHLTTSLTCWHLAQLPLPPCCSLLWMLSSLDLLLLLPRLAVVCLWHLVWSSHPYLTRLRHRARCASPHIIHLRLLHLTSLTVGCLSLSLTHLHLARLTLRYLATLALRHTVGPNLHLVQLRLWRLWPNHSRLSPTYLIWECLAWTRGSHLHLAWRLDLRSLLLSLTWSLGRHSTTLNNLWSRFCDCRL